MTFQPHYSYEVLTLKSHILDRLVNDLESFLNFWCTDAEQFEHSNLILINLTVRSLDGFGLECTRV